MTGLRTAVAWAIAVAALCAGGVALASSDTGDAAAGGTFVVDKAKGQPPVSKTSGFCKKRDIARVVRKRSHSLRSCYERYRRKFPKARGKISARWTVGLRGKVSKVAIVKNTVAPAVGKCVGKVIMRMRFARPEGGKCVVQWPFKFAPPKKGR